MDGILIDTKNKNQTLVSQLLEARMKIYEHNEHKVIPSDRPFIVRLDGSNFKKYTS